MIFMVTTREVIIMERVYEVEADSEGEIELGVLSDSALVDEYMVSDESSPHIEWEDGEVIISVKPRDYDV